MFLLTWSLAWTEQFGLSVGGSWLPLSSSPSAVMSHQWQQSFPLSLCSQCVCGCCPCPWTGLYQQGCWGHPCSGVKGLAHGSPWATVSSSLANLWRRQFVIRSWKLTCHFHFHLTNTFWIFTANLTLKSVKRHPNNVKFIVAVDFYFLYT